MTLVEVNNKLNEIEKKATIVMASDGNGVRQGDLESYENLVAQGQESTYSVNNVVHILQEDIEAYQKVLAVLGDETHKNNQLKALEERAEIVSAPGNVLVYKKYYNEYCDIYEYVMTLPENERPNLNDIAAEYRKQPRITVLNSDIQEYRDVLHKQFLLKRNEKYVAKLNNKAKKVNKRRNYKWKNKDKKHFTFLRGLLFGENLRGKSEQYIAIHSEINQMRAEFKSLSIDERIDRLNSIDNKIESNQDLSYSEKKRLYKKLHKLAKKVQRKSHKSKKRILKEANEMYETLNAEDYSLRRAA